MKNDWKLVSTKGGSALLAAALLLPALACGKADSGESAAAGSAETLVAAAPAQRVMGAETPEALVARMKAAAKAQDIAEMAACMSPDTRTEMAMGMYLGATMMVAFSQMGLEMGGAMADGMGEMMSDEDKKKAEENMKEGRAQVAKLHDDYNALVGKYGLPKLPAEGEPEAADMPKEEAERVFASIDQGAFVADVMKLLESMPSDDPKPSADEASPIKIPDGPLENLQIAGDAATGSVGDEELQFVRIDGRWFVDMPEQEMGEPAPE